MFNLINWLNFSDFFFSNDLILIIGMVICFVRLVSVSYVWTEVRKDDIPVHIFLTCVVCVLIIFTNFFICIKHWNMYSIIMIIFAFLTRFFLKKNKTKMRGIEKYSDYIFNIYIFIYYILSILSVYVLLFLV